jgi:hypothetical protein
LSYVSAWLTWPIREYFLTWWYEHKAARSTTDNKLIYEKKHRVHQVQSTRAHLIEVCCESSMMALLQFYLFFPTVIYYTLDLHAPVDDVLTDRTLRQLYSIITSLFSIAWKFTTNYKLVKIMIAEI